jgi:hypothetical protein
VGNVCNSHANEKWSFIFVKSKIYTKMKVGSTTPPTSKITINNEIKLDIKD